MDIFPLIGRALKSLPLERIFVPSRDPQKELLKFLEKQQGDLAAATPAPAISQEITEEIPAASLEEKATGVKSGCIPCTLGHFSACSGDLEEAMRFARADGMQSDEVIDRIGSCLVELNGLERHDLKPGMIRALPAWEKELAVTALTHSRQARHRLESVKTVDDFEGIAADMDDMRRGIFRAWVKGKAAHMPQESEAQLRAGIERSTGEGEHD